MGFQGVTAHLKDGCWKMKAAVVGFKGIYGAHSGQNLGRYMVGLLDCVGIMDKRNSKVGDSCILGLPHDQSSRTSL